MDAARLRNSPHVAIIGSSSLLGKELKEMIEDGVFPLGKLVLLETEEYAGLLQEFAGEIQITQIISPEALRDVDIAFFACSPEIMRTYIASGATFPELSIDLTQSGRPGTLFLNGVSDPSLLHQRGYFVSPDPATIALARVLSRLHEGLGVRSAAITMLEPVSEYGSAGVEELQEQTVNLLNFQQIEKKVFGDQIAFNVLAIPAQSQVSESRVLGQISELFGADFPIPMIASIQAPVFHSHAFSVFVQCEGSPTESAVRALFQNDGSSRVHEDGDNPSPVGVVGTDTIHVGRIQGVPSRPGAFWLWIAADNLRISASNAIQIAQKIMLSPGN